MALVVLVMVAMLKVLEGLVFEELKDVETTVYAVDRKQTGRRRYVR